MKRALLPCLLLSVPLASTRTIKIPRQPDYHDGKIAFSYMGDIWVVNDNGSNPESESRGQAFGLFIGAANPHFVDVPTPRRFAVQPSTRGRQVGK